MPAVAIELVGWSILLTVLVLWAMGHNTPTWVGSLLHWIFKDRRSWWANILLKPVQIIVGGIASGVRFLTRVIMGSIWNGLTLVGRALHGYAWLLDLASLNYLRLAQEMLLAFRYLRNTAIPRLANAAVDLIRPQVTTALATAQAVAKDLTQASTNIAAGLRQLPWGVPLGFPARVGALMDAIGHLWDDYFHNLKPAFVHLTTVVLPKELGRIDDVWDDLYHSGADGIAGIRRRLKTLEDALTGLGTSSWWQLGVLGAIAALAGVSIAIVRASIGSLFCRNTRDVTGRLCAASPTSIANLLALFAGFALVLDPKLVLRLGQEVEQSLDGVFREMASL